MCGPLVVFLLSGIACLAWTSSPKSCPPTILVNQTKETSLEFEHLYSKAGCLNFSGKGLISVDTGSLRGRGVTELDLSQNNLTELQGDLLDQAEVLEALYLQGNHLKKFPPELLKNVPSLKVLRLEGNHQLASVNLSRLGHCLGNVSADCRCGVVDDILTYLTNCTQRGSYRCLFHQQGAMKMVDYHRKTCHGGISAGIYAAIIVPVVVLAAALGLAVILMKRRKTSGISRDKRGSSVSEGVHGQPRYISHAGPPGEASRPFGHSAEYENVQVPRGRPGESLERTTSKNRTAPRDEEPIYANAPNTYCNYNGPSGAGKGAEDDIYVIPDQ